MLTVLILTRNEEQDLPGCLDSVAELADDVVVLDSHSTDATRTIAASYGAQVFRRAFDDWSSHLNWALANLPFAHPFVLLLDADERVTPELADSLRRAARDPGPHAAFSLRRRDHLHGRWLRRVQATPFLVRFFRPGKVRFARLVNPTIHVMGSVGRLEGSIDHFPFSKGLAHWFARHNDYSTLEARENVAAGAPGRGTLWAALRAPDLHLRRRAQKALFSRLPLRPLLKFVVLYGLRGGFLDGRPGLTYALLQSVYEWMIVLKERELRALEAGAQELPCAPGPSLLRAEQIVRTLSPEPGPEPAPVRRPGCPLSPEPPGT